MDIVTAAREPVLQATEEDLRRVLASDFGASVSLVRNYGDRIDAVALTADLYRVSYCDAASGQSHEAAAHWTRAEVGEGFLDYFLGNWNWHGWHAWNAVE